MKSRHRKRPVLLVEELEPRILYSADFGALAHPDALAPAAEVRVLDPGVATPAAAEVVAPDAVVPPSTDAIEGDRATDLAATANTSSVAAQIASVPLAFEANAGQTDQAVDFLARGSGYGVFLTGGNAVLQLGSGATSQVVRLDVAGANANAAVSGGNLLSGHSNYLEGNDPTQWLTGINQYASVQYTGIYDGIDLRYYGNQRELEYDFIVAAGADAANIQLNFQGVQATTVDAATGD